MRERNQSRPVSVRLREQASILVYFKFLIVSQRKVIQIDRS